MHHREFLMASGELSLEQFGAFLVIVMTNMANFSTDGSLHYHFMDWRHAAEIIAAGKAAYSELANICVWRKTNAGMGSLYRSQHEFVFVFKNGSAAHINNVNLGVHGRNRSTSGITVASIASVNTAMNYWRCILPLSRWHSSPT